MQSWLGYLEDNSQTKSNYKDANVIADLIRNESRPQENTQFVLKAKIIIEDTLE